MAFLEQKIRILEDSEKPDVSAEKGVCTHFKISSSQFFGIFIHEQSKNILFLFNVIVVRSNCSFYQYIAQLRYLFQQFSPSGTSLNASEFQKAWLNF